jgi:hypothetical protein
VKCTKCAVNGPFEEFFDGHRKRLEIWKVGIQSGSIQFWNSRTMAVTDALVSRVIHICLYENV